VTGTLIAPVIPSPAAARPARAPAAARTLPLTVPPVRPPALPRDVVYGLAHVDRSGLVTLPPRSCVPIPAALRHRCGLHPGDPVLLTAIPAEDTLTAYSLAVVDQALAAHIPFPAREGGDR
jgi:hypothetical protein